MLEKEFENILAENPSLIEDSLSLEGKQVQVDRKFIDLLFKDKNGHLLIVEAKRDAATRKDVAQLIDYAGYFVKPNKPPIRVMLVANRIPQNFRNAFEYFGIEYKEIPFEKLQQYMPIPSEKSVSDQKEMAELSQEVQIDAAINKNRNITRQNMARRIKAGKMFKQAQCAVELLSQADQPVTMPEIREFMTTKGYRSKTYFDLLNALCDAGIVETTVTNGKKGYFIKEA